MAVLALKQWFSLKFMQCASIISSESFWKIYLHRWINLEFPWSSLKVVRTSTRGTIYVISPMRVQGISQGANFMKSIGGFLFQHISTAWQPVECFRTPKFKIRQTAISGPPVDRLWHYCKLKKNRIGQLMGPVANLETPKSKKHQLLHVTSMHASNFFVKTWKEHKFWINFFEEVLQKVITETFKKFYVLHKKSRAFAIGI